MANKGYKASIKILYFCLNKLKIKFRQERIQINFEI